MAALLSFLWPGLGQLYLRNRRAAVIFAAPALLLLLLLAYGLRRGPAVFVAELFANRTTGLAAVAIVVLFGAWRLAAVAHAFVDGEWREWRGTGKVVDRVVLGVLAAIIVTSHVAAADLVLVTSNAGTHVFNQDSSLVDLTTPSPGAGSQASASPGPTPTPVVTPPIGSRVTILFTGVDADPTRGEHLYDSLMVVSYDPKTNSVQMISVPRDSASFPMYFSPHPVVSGATAMNAVPTYVHNGYIHSPDSPYMTLVNEISYLVGIPINYYAVMDLSGFVKMIDMVGGIDVDNPAAIDDYYYDWLDGSPYGFHLAAGRQHLDGRHALAYVRSRRGAGDNDYTRASRQQEVLIDLLHKMAQPSQILALPSLISTLGASVTTNFPADKVADYVAIGQDIPGANFKQFVLGVPDYSIYLPNGRSCLLNDKVSALSIKLFGTDSLWDGKPAPENTCP